MHGGEVLSFIVGLVVSDLILNKVKTKRTRKYIYLRQVVKNGKKVIFLVLPCRFIFEQTCLKRKRGKQIKKVYV